MNGDSPPTKISRTVAFGSPSSDRFADVNDAIDDVVETVDALAKNLEAGGASITGSPGSEVSDVSHDQGIADQAARALRNTVEELRRLKLKTQANVLSSTGTRQMHLQEVKPEDVWAPPKGKSIDAYQIDDFYEDPNSWPKDLKRAYKSHLEHNVTMVRKALGPDVVAEKQVRDFFSSRTEIISVLDYPPAKEVGDFSNLAFVVSEKYTLANSLQVPVLGVKSLCIRQYCYAFAKTSGSHNEEFETVNAVCQEDLSSVTVAVNSTAREALRMDLVERHPTCIRNDFDMAKLISKSSLGRRHVEEGDRLFGAFIKQRQLYVENRLAGSLEKRRAPVFVWNAGLSSSGYERTGALAALFVSLERAGVEELQGMHHPSFVFRKENPLVQISAASYDRAVCDACHAAGRAVVDECVWQRFVGVANMTAEERLLREREAREFYVALGRLAWMSEGKPGTSKRAVYDELIGKDVSHETAAYMAQARMLSDGLFQAVARRAGMSEEEFSALSADERHELREEGKFECQVREAAKRAGLGDDALAGMSREQKKKLVDEDNFECQVREAAKRAGLGDDALAGMSREQKKELVDEDNFECQVREAAKRAGLGDDALAGMSREQKKKLVAKDQRLRTLENACEALGENFQAVASPEWTDAERIELLRFYRMMGIFETVGLDVSTFSAEDRKHVLAKYDKRMILQKMGVTMPDDDDDDDDDAPEGDRIDITNDVGMLLSLNDISSMVALTRDRGTTPKKAAAVMCAVNLGIAREEAEALSPVDLVLAQVHYRNRAKQERKKQRGIFCPPGTPGHAEVLQRIELHMRVCGVGKLMDTLNAEAFANDWAFWLRQERRDRSDFLLYVYISDKWRGIPIWVNAMDRVNRTLGIENAGREPKSFSLVTEFVFRSRLDLFKDKLKRDALERLVPTVPFTDRFVDRRIRTHMEVVQNNEGECFFEGDETFNELLGQLSDDPRATFDKDGTWKSRICLRRKTKMDRGLRRFYTNMYFCDDEGVWLGPHTRWGLLEDERHKESVTANVEILNALDARLGTAPAA